jgi:CBS domain-containing protein
VVSGVGNELSAPLSELVTRKPLYVPEDSTVGETARIMRMAKVSSALVAGRPHGIVTNGDLRDRVLAEELPPSTPVRSVMSSPVATLPEDAPLYEALLLMLGEDLEHVPVTRDRLVVGVITRTDMLRHQSRSPVLVLGRIRAIDQLSDAQGYSAEIAATAGAMFDDGVEPVRIARVIASLNDALCSRLLRIAEEQLGPPPCPYAWLVLGSEGRMEQVLLSDQDNALVYRDDDDPAAARYFGDLAALVVGALLEAGFPACTGGYMATNWCRPLPEWVRTFARWIDAPEPQALVEAAVFLDFRPVHGELSLEPLHQALLRAADAGRFLVQLSRAAASFEPPLGTFGRIRTDDRQLDLKRGAIAAIVLLGRLYGLASGSAARSTLERFEAAAVGGLLSPVEARLLTDALGFVTSLRLRAQLRTLAAGCELDNRVRLDDLSWLEQRRLRDTLKSIADLQKATTMRFHSE